MVSVGVTSPPNPHPNLDISEAQSAASRKGPELSAGLGNEPLLEKRLLQGVGVAWNLLHHFVGVVNRCFVHIYLSSFKNHEDPFTGSDLMCLL